MPNPALERVNSADFENTLLKECRDRIAQAKACLDQVLAVKGAHTELNTLLPFNELEKHLDSAGSLASLMASVHPRKQVREAAEVCESEVSRFRTELSLNLNAFKAFAAVDPAALDAPARRWLEKTLLDYKRSGVDKDETTRDKIKQLNEELVLIGQEFDRNVRDDVRSIVLSSATELEGLPQDYIDAHKPDAKGQITLTTDYPDVLPFMAYAKSGSARKKLAEVFKNRAYPKNEDVLKRLLDRRAELAKVLGYSSWAAYVTEDKMIKTSAAVAKFIEEVSAISGPRAKRELAELLIEKRKDEPNAQTIEDWEKTYYEERVKIAKYAFDSKSVRPYFEFGRVKAGLLELTGELFSVEYVKIPQASVWHSSVDAYEVKDRVNKKDLGRIYLDLHPRDGKFKHAAQFTLRSGIADVQLPEGVLVCNFPDPAASVGPALMEHGDVVTLFHEFGHLLHHVLGGHQKWIRFSGVATEWDFVEAPSQFLEEWAWDARVLQRFARHIETNAPIPEDLVQKMKAADEFGQGFAARQQMFYAALSLQYHQQNPNEFDAFELMKELQARYSIFPHQDGTHFHLNFGHLNGYSAMYYTYMWSQVIAKDLLSEFKRKGMMNADLAGRYRKTVLEPGGSQDAADLVQKFLGRQYSFDAFRDWLNC